MVLIFVQRIAKKHKLSADAQTVEDLGEAVKGAEKRKVRWAEVDDIIGGEPEPMLPPASMDGFRPGTLKYMTASGEAIQAATRDEERRRRSGRRYKARTCHSTGPTIEVDVEGAENDQSPDEPQGEHDDDEEEEEEEEAEVVEDDEDGLVAELRATFSPPPNWYDDEGELNEDEMSLDG